MAIKIKQIAGAVILAAAAIGAAHADTVKFNGFLDGRNATADLNTPVNGNYPAGEFSILLNGQSFTSLCVDVTHHISFGPTYTDYTVKTASSYGFSNTQIGLFNKLYTAHYAESHASSEKAAAFQMAVWEITYDGNGALNLGTNSFTMGTTGNNNAKNIATGWLNTLNNAQQGNWKFTVLDSKDYQDQLVAAPVPEPAEFAMLLAGLGMIGSIARRKTRTVSAA